MEWAQILTNEAWYKWMRGTYKEAQRAVAKAVTAREMVLGKDKKLTLISINLLALVLWA
jgi:hypothetical protein